VRVDISLSMTQLAQLLDIGVSSSAIEKREKHQNCSTTPYRKRIIEFLGFDPESFNPTGDYS